MFGQSLLSAFGSAACTTDTNQLFTSTAQAATTATYELNGNVNSIGNVYNGTVSSGTATYTTGVFGQAADFSNWNISVPNLSADLQNTAFSMSFWATPGNSTSYYLMTAGSSGGTRKGFLIGTTNGTLNIRFNNLTTNYFDINASMPSGFNHYVCSFDNTTNANGVKIYVNGVLTTQGTSTGLNNFTFSTSTFFIGSEPTDSGQGPSYNSSNLDQLRIFKSAISQDVVTALYNETTTTAQSASVDYQLANPNSIAYYKMSNATDQLGNYNGTATNVNFNTIGKFGFAGGFNGSSSVITTSLDLDTLTNYTISMWINPSSLSKFLAGTINSAASNGIYFYLNSNGTVRFVERTTSSNTLTSTDTISTNTWNHLVFVRDGSTNYIYVNNGTPVSISNWNITNSVGFTLARGGDYTPVNTAYYNGLIDQVRIYDSALSAANVTTLYNEIECPPLTTFYTSLNPSDAVNGSLSSGNLRFTSTTTPWSQCRTVQSVSSGKYYFEMYVHSATNNSLGIGIADASISNSGSLWGQAAGGIVYYGQNGDKFENTASGGFSSTFGPGSWLMCAFDMDAGKLWFGLNGNWIGANPSTGNSPASSIIKTYITNAKPFANAYYAGNSVEMNFGNGNSVNANTFKYTPPTGFDGILA